MYLEFKYKKKYLVPSSAEDTEEVRYTDINWW